MEKKVLIAVDSSRHSENAVRYASEMSRTLKDIKFTLFHVQPAVSQYLLDEARRDPRANAELKKLTMKNSLAAQELLDRYKSRMTEAGVPESDVQLVTRTRSLGVAKDILEHCLAQRFDAVVMGRRGLSGLETVFIGSVSANTVTHSEVTPVWLVDEQAPSRDILVAVDGSESSLRAVDHLSLILRGTTDAKLSFLHVTPKVGDYCEVDFGEDRSEPLEEIIRRGDKACIDRFFSHALQKLEEAGIPQSRIEVQVSEGAFRIGKTVLDSFRKGRFGTLVIGRRGESKRFFTGSVSRYLINQLSNGALWVVP
jgi:nucleotide-binding universal stress UspA family protein